MDNEQFERLIQSIDSLTEAVRNLEGGTGDKRRVANAKVEREVFERQKMEQELSDEWDYDDIVNQLAIDAIDF